MLIQNLVLAGPFVAPLERDFDAKSVDLGRGGGLAGPFLAGPLAGAFSGVLVGVLGLASCGRCRGCAGGAFSNIIFLSGVFSSISSTISP